MKTLIRELKEAGIKALRNHGLKEHTTFRIGGRADVFIPAGSIDELSAAVRILRKHKKKYIVLGNMSNVLIKDGKVKIAVIHPEKDFNGVEFKGKTGVSAGCAVKVNLLLSRMAARGLGGLEFMAGIPGSLGGAVYMNAGAFGKSIASRITKIYTVDSSGRRKTVKNVKHVFSYRKSRFMHTGEIITGVEIKAAAKNRKKTEDGIREIIRARHKKHPWKACCAGSFFKNGSNFTAAELIEGSGLKGASCGGAQVSEKHANFIINKGNARYSDVVKLAGLIKRKVYAKYGIKLTEEVRIIR